MTYNLCSPTKQEPFKAKKLYFPHVSPVAQPWEKEEIQATGLPRCSSIAEHRSSRSFQALLARPTQSELILLSRQMSTVPIRSMLLTGGISNEPRAGIGEVSAGQVVDERCSIHNV